jgi:nicotinic acid mononucleotide adenylyltransferase
VPSETGKILLQSVPQLDISSTQIRSNLSNNQDISQWVSTGVHQQLMRKEFYDN